MALEMPLSKAELVRRDVCASLDAIERGELLHHDGRKQANWPAYMSQVSGMDLSCRGEGPNRGAIATGNHPNGYRDWVSYLRPDEIAQKVLPVLGEAATVDMILLLESSAMREAALKAIGKLSRVDVDVYEFDVQDVIFRALRHMPQMELPKPKPQKPDERLVKPMTEPKEKFQAELEGMDKTGVRPNIESFMGGGS